MAGTFDISTINVISPNGLVTKSLTVDNYGYAKIGDERVGVTPQNWIINGMFNIWQRGTSFTTPYAYCEDMWFNVTLESSVSTNSRQLFTVGQTDVPNNPKYYKRIITTTGGLINSQTSMRQLIEDVTKLAGKTVTLSFWAKADASKSVSVSFAQNFGTGGSALVFNIGSKKFTLSSSWQRFTTTLSMPSISGKTVGDGSSTFVWFWFDAGSDYNARTDSLGNQSGTFDIANVCLVEGSVPVECPSEPYGEVLRKCQRYYQRYGGKGLYESYGVAWAVSTTLAYASLFLPVPLRTIPSSVEYSTLRLVELAVNQHAVTNVVISSGETGNTKIELQLTSSGLTANKYHEFGSYDSLSAYLGLSAEL